MTTYGALPGCLLQRKMLVYSLLVSDPTLTMPYFSLICHLKLYLASPHNCYMTLPTMDFAIYGQPISRQLKNISPLSKTVSTRRTFTIKLPYLSPNANAWVNAHRMMNEFRINLTMLSLRSCYEQKLNAKK